MSYIKMFSNVYYSYSIYSKYGEIKGHAAALQGTSDFVEGSYIFFIRVSTISNNYRLSIPVSVVGGSVVGSVIQLDIRTSSGHAQVYFDGCVALNKHK